MTLRLLLSPEARQILQLHDTDKASGSWVRLKKVWPSKFAHEIPDLRDYAYHPTVRATAEVVREHWLWHLWQHGLAPLERSVVSTTSLNFLSSIALPRFV